MMQTDRTVRFHVIAAEPAFARRQSTAASPPSHSAKAGHSRPFLWPSRHTRRGSHRSCPAGTEARCPRDTRCPAWRGTAAASHARPLPPLHAHRKIAGEAGHTRPSRCKTQRRHGGHSPGEPLRGELGDVCSAAPDAQRPGVEVGPSCRGDVSIPSLSPTSPWPPRPTQHRLLRGGRGDCLLSVRVWWGRNESHEHWRASRHSGDGTGDSWVPSAAER